MSNEIHHSVITVSHSVGATGELQSRPSLPQMFSNMDVPFHSTLLILSTEPHCGNEEASSKDFQMSHAFHWQAP